MSADVEPRRSTFSERKMFKECKRKWWFSHYRKLALVREEMATAATLGTRVHEPLGIYYDPADRRDPMAVLEERARDDVAQDFPPDKLKKIENEIVLARLMVEGYFEWLEETGADEDLEVIGAETHVEVRLGEIRGRVVTLLSKQDMRANRRSDGARVFVDHKTVQSFEERVLLLHLDEQMKSYHLAEFLLMLENGEDLATRTDGAIYNMLRKVKRSATAKPPFYQRETVHHNLHVLRAYWKQVWGEMDAILAVEHALDAGGDPAVLVPPNPTRDCSWKCPFLPVCPMVDDSSMAAERVIGSYYFETDPLARYSTPTE
jgi:hypothetical protein